MYSKGNTIFWAVTACLLWSTAAATIKLGLQYDTPFHFAGLRFIIAGLLIVPFTVRPRTYLEMVKDHWKVIAWVTFFQIVVNYSLLYQGLKYVPGALGAVVIGAQPLIIAIVASIMNNQDQLTTSKILTIIFGISGVILISAGRQAFKFGTSSELIGVFMILAANVGNAMSNVVVSLKSRGLNPAVLSSCSIFCGGLILYLISILSEGVVSNPKPNEYWIILTWLSIMAAAAFSIWFTLLQRSGVKVSEINLWKFIIPVIGAILSWLLVPNESPEWLTITGMIIITVSLIMFNRRAMVVTG